MVAGKPESLRDRARRNATAQGIRLEQLPPQTQKFDPDLIPEVGAAPRGEEDLALDAVLDRLDILDAYRRWAGKGEPGDPGSKTESIMIRCPRPHHEDLEPSAWVNTDKQVWHCGACDEGGDKFDIAAWHFGFPVPGYKKDFGDLRRRMAVDLGYAVKRTPTGREYVEPGARTDPDPAGQAPAVDSTPLAPVVVMPAAAPPDTVEGYIDWQALLPPGSFLRQWMELVTDMDVPDEYLLWNGILAVNFAAGNDVVMRDFTDVKSNLFVCMFGSSGSGKSRSLIPLSDLLKAALPYDHSDPNNTGVMLNKTPASAESLIDSFSKPIVDPTGVHLGWAAVRGLIQYAELSNLIGKASRIGSVLKPTLMEFYDAHDSVAMRSRGAGFVHAEKPFAQAVTTTQVRSAADLLRGADADSGFLNRWVFVTCTLKKRIAIGGVRINVDPLVRPLQALRAWSSSGRRVEMDAAGAAAYTEWFENEYVPTTTGNDEEVLIQRCDLLMKKLIITFCVDQRTAVATESIVKQALALWPYLTQSYGAVRARLGVVATEEAGDAILQALSEFRDMGVNPTARDLYARKLRRKFKDKKVLIEALAQLRSFELIEELVTIHPKKKTSIIRYRLAEDS